PTSPSTSPRCRDGFTPSTALTVDPPPPISRPSALPRNSKWTSRSRTSINVLSPDRSASGSWSSFVGNGGLLTFQRLLTTVGDGVERPVQPALHRLCTDLHRFGELRRAHRHRIWTARVE